MDYNQTDKEQIEALKNWWHQYGKYLVIAVIIGLLGGFGWRYWQQHRQQNSAKASLAYDNMLSAVMANKPEKIAGYAKSIQQFYAGTPYAALATLIWAKQLVAQQKLPEAYQQLNWIMQHSTQKVFQQIARLRAARILIAEHKPDQALSLLAVVQVKTYLPVINEVQGDAYHALAENKKAHEAYQQAAKEYVAVGMQNPVIQMKLMDN